LKEPVKSLPKSKPTEVKTPARSHPNASPEGNELVLTLGSGMDIVFVRVPSGEFIMGSKDGDKDEKPQHEVHLGEYWMGKYPVTNAQYKAFVDASGHRAPDGWKKDEIPKGMEKHPVVYVSWHDAIAFCEWASQANGETIRLPSEAEWEKAARGTDGRKYPWGNQKPDKSLCKYGNLFGDTDPVSAHSPAGDSPYGCADMAGNVWEWTSSICKAYPYREDDGRENPQTKGDRVLRGGSWNNDVSDVRSPYRNRSGPDDAYFNIGFRCARSLRTE